MMDNKSTIAGSKLKKISAKAAAKIKAKRLRLQLEILCVFLLFVVCVMASAPQ